MAMKSSFSALADNRATRKFGGTVKGIASPYISGTFFIWFDKLPSALTTYTKEGISGIGTEDEIRAILTAACTAVTPPGGTLNKVEFTGLGGIKWAVPGNIDYGNSVSLKFIEFSKTPILDIMHSWVKMIRDYRLGITDVLKESDSKEFSKRNYAATLYYWTTAPDGAAIEYYACYDGVFPTKDPQDLFSSDVETVGRVDPEIEFNVDYAWHEPWVKTNIQKYIDIIQGDIKNVKTFGNTSA